MSQLPEAESVNCVIGYEDIPASDVMTCGHAVCSSCLVRLDKAICPVCTRAFDRRARRGDDEITWGPLLSDEIVEQIGRREEDARNQALTEQFLLSERIQELERQGRSVDPNQLYGQDLYSEEEQRQMRRFEEWSSRMASLRRELKSLDLNLDADMMDAIIESGHAERLVDSVKREHWGEKLREVGVRFDRTMLNAFILGRSLDDILSEAVASERLASGGSFSPDSLIRIVESGLAGEILGYSPARSVPIPPSQFSPPIERSVPSAQAPPPTPVRATAPVIPSAQAPPPPTPARDAAPVILPRPLSAVPITSLSSKPLLLPAVRISLPPSSATGIPAPSSRPLLPPAAGIPAPSSRPLLPPAAGIPAPSSRPLLPPAAGIPAPSSRPLLPPAVRLPLPPPSASPAVRLPLPPPSASPLPTPPRVGLPKPVLPRSRLPAPAYSPVILPLPSGVTPVTPISSGIQPSPAATRRPSSPRSQSVTPVPPFISPSLLSAQEGPQRISLDSGGPMIRLSPPDPLV